MVPLDELFDVVVDSSEVGVRKPDPRIFELALAELGDVDPARSVFLDDFLGNVEAARRLGHVRHRRRVRSVPGAGRARPTARRRSERHNTLKHQLRLVATPGPSFDNQNVASTQF